MHVDSHGSVSEKFVAIRDLNECAKRDLALIDQKRNPADVQHQVLFISLVRVVKYFDAYLMLAEKGYGEPAAALLRSIYEADIWMRWSLISRENAETYFNGSKDEALRMLESLLSRGFPQLAGMTDQARVRQLLGDRLKSHALPRWTKLARECGLEDLHALIYPMLSGMSHGNMLFLGERLHDGKLVSPTPDEKNVEPFIPIANNILRDCYLVCRRWIVDRELHPVPDVRRLLVHSCEEEDCCPS